MKSCLITSESCVVVLLHKERYSFNSFHNTQKRLVQFKVRGYNKFQDGGFSDDMVYLLKVQLMNSILQQHIHLSG